jgi:hypothetical protein
MIKNYIPDGASVVPGETTVTLFNALVECTRHMPEDVLATRTMLDIAREKMGVARA